MREYERTCVRAGVHACMLSVCLSPVCVCAYVRAGVHACMHVYLYVWLVS